MGLNILPSFRHCIRITTYQFSLLPIAPNQNRIARPDFPDKTYRFFHPVRKHEGMQSSHHPSQILKCLSPPSSHPWSSSSTHPNIRIQCDSILSPDNSCRVDNNKTCGIDVERRKLLGCVEPDFGPAYRE